MASFSTKYNGWSNYETWLTNLHFDDFDFSDYLSELRGKDKWEVTEWIASYIEETVRYYIEDQSSSNIFLSDVIGSFVGDVDWHEIADHYAEDVLVEIADRDEQVKHELSLAYAC